MQPIKCFDVSEFNNALSIDSAPMKYCDYGILRFGGQFGIDRHFHYNYSVMRQNHKKLALYICCTNPIIVDMLISKYRDAYSQHHLFLDYEDSDIEKYIEAYSNVDKHGLSFYCSESDQERVQKLFNPCCKWIANYSSDTPPENCDIWQRGTEQYQWNSYDINEIVTEAGLSIFS